MELNPSDIVKGLSKKDQALLNAILQIEKQHLHFQEIKTNSRVEKEIVGEIVKLFDKAVSDDN